MRSIRKLSTYAVVSLSLLSPLSVSASPQQAKALADIEAKGLRSVGSERLETMISAAASPSKIEFTRSWLAQQPKASGGEQWKCLSEALYFEARGETIKGQFAVAEVILNRVKSRQFPGSLCSVINQGTGKKYQCQLTKGATYYHTKAVSPRWSRVFTRTAQIGVHLFYRDGVQTASND